MKNIFLLVLTMLMVASCNSQKNKAIKDQEAAYAQLKEMKRPGTLPAANGGWTMTAKINGKDWKATSLMQPELADRIIGYYNNEYISLPYDRSFLVAGRKVTFSEHNVVDLAIEDEVGLYGGKTGEMTIIKVSNGWVEGSFFCTGSSKRSNKTVTVASGFFRFAIPK